MGRLLLYLAASQPNTEMLGCCCWQVPIRTQLLDSAKPYTTQCFPAPSPRQMLSSCSVSAAPTRRMVDVYKTDLCNGNINWSNRIHRQRAWLLRGSLDDPAMAWMMGVGNSPDPDWGEPVFDRLVEAVGRWARVRSEATDPDRPPGPPSCLCENQRIVWHAVPSCRHAGDCRSAGRRCPDHQPRESERIRRSGARLI
jgi:hypothetical protein